MNRSLKILLWCLLGIAILALGAFYVSTHNVPVLEPKGMIGHKERELIFTASLLMLLVVIPVFVMTWVFAVKFREGKSKDQHDPEWAHSNTLEALWWGVPCVIIVILAVLTYKTSHELNPFKPIESDKRPMTVQVVALQWKWLFIYPEQGIATVNYLQFPEKTPINFEITADAPMNSFWIPQLGGQIYAMPAMRTKLHLIADEVGTYAGSSSNFSGKWFDGMRFQVTSSTDGDFANWVQTVKQNGGVMDIEAYRDLVKPSGYNPVSSYILRDGTLFDQIIEQYEPPGKRL